MGTRAAWGSISKRKGRAGWWLRYHDADGVRRLQRAGDTLDEAERTRERIRGEVEGNLPPADERSFAQWLIDPYLPLMRTRVAKTTFVRCSGILLDAAAAWGEKPVAALTRHDVENLVARHSRAGAMPNTQRRVVSVLSTAFATAIDRGTHRGPNPASKIKLPRVAQTIVPYLEPAQMATLYAACAPTIRPYIEFLGETGCRVGEMKRLTWADVESSAVNVFAPKTGKVRRIPLTPRAAAVIDAQRVTQGKEATVFYPLDRVHLWRFFQVAVKSVGLKRARLTDLRHWFASGLVRAGVPIPAIVQLLGHSSPELVLRIYGVHAPGDASTVAIAALARARGQLPPA